MDYENIANWTLGENKPNSKPIKPKTNPIQSQYKPNQSQYKPNLVRHSLGEGGFKGKKMLLRLTINGRRESNIKIDIPAFGCFNASLCSRIFP